MLLLQRLVDTDGSRVVGVSSVGHRFKSSLDPATMMSGERYDRVAAYGRSKLANLLFTYELQRRLSAIGSSTLAVVAHPGVSDTELGRSAPRAIQTVITVGRPFLQAAAMGALPTLRAATDPAAAGGQYFGPDGVLEFRGHPVVVESSARSTTRAYNSGCGPSRNDSPGSHHRSEHRHQVPPRRRSTNVNFGPPRVPSPIDEGLGVDLCHRARRPSEANVRGSAQGHGSPGPIRSLVVIEYAIVTRRR